MKKLVLLFILAFSLGINAQVKDSTKVDNFQKTDEVLADVVKKALTVAEKTGNFAIEQAPLLLQEFYAWHITKCILTLIMWIIFFIICYVGLRKIKKYGKDENLDMSDAEYFFPIVFSYLGALISIGFLFASIYDLVFILVAPKLYLIEYFIK